eukprot:4074557-Alexandrium_andersonii.AAC.1
MCGTCGQSQSASRAQANNPLAADGWTIIRGRGDAERQEPLCRQRHCVLQGRLHVRGDPPFGSLAVVAIGPGDPAPGPCL